MLATSLQKCLLLTITNELRVRSKTSWMKPIFRLHTAFLLLGLLSAWGPAAKGQDASSRIKSQIDHLRQALQSKPVGRPEWKEAIPDIAESLQRADDDLREGRLYLSLEELAGAWDSLRGTEGATQKTEEELLKEGLPGVESELKGIQIELTAFEKQATQKNWDAAPVAVRALAEKATGQTLNLLEGAHGFAILTDVEKRAFSENYASALYYAGESKAQAEFNAFCNTLDLPRKSGALPLRSISPELQQLQTRVMAAYRPPRSVKHHVDFIRLNATLKLAGELDAAKLYAGALYQYLDATQQFAVFDAAMPAAAKQSRLRKSLQKMRTYLVGSQQDQSIAQLFLERAEAGLTRSPGATDWITVETIVEQVLPAYFAALKASPPSEHRAPAGVTVTLVRWPYT
jgi:hypothetical protein